MALILVWILNAVALLAVAYLLPGITVASFGSALIAALVLGLVNMLVKPVLVLLTLPITIVTLGRRPQPEYVVAAHGAGVALREVIVADMDPASLTSATEGATRHGQ